MVLAANAVTPEKGEPMHKQASRERIEKLLAASHLLSKNGCISNGNEPWKAPWKNLWRPIPLASSYLLRREHETSPC
jgi:hypothetical protein